MDKKFWLKLYQGIQKPNFQKGDIVYISNNPYHPTIHEAVIVKQDYMPYSWIVCDSQKRTYPIRENDLRLIDNIFRN